MEEKSQKMEENSSKMVDDLSKTQEKKLIFWHPISPEKTGDVKTQMVNTQTIRKTKNTHISVTDHRNAVACNTLGDSVVITTLLPTPLFAPSPLP